MSSPHIEFSISRRDEGGVAIVAPEGEVDLATAEPVREAVRAAIADARRIAVDLRGVTFMDSSGLRLLVEFQLDADREGWTLIVVRGPEQVQRLLDLVGLGQRLALVDDPLEAGGNGASATG